MSRTVIGQLDEIRSVEHERRSGVAPDPVSGRHRPAPPNAVIPQRRHEYEAIDHPKGETVLPVAEEVPTVGKPEEVSDAVTGDRIYDKTGKVVR